MESISLRAWGVRFRAEAFGELYCRAWQKVCERAWPATHTSGRMAYSKPWKSSQSSSENTSLFQEAQCVQTYP